MRRRILKYCMIFFTLIAFSCEDILDITVKSSITGQNFWQSENDFTSYVFGIYSQFRRHLDNMAFGEDRCEMWKTGYNERFSPYWSQNITAGNTRDWTSYYGTIGNCNLLLEKIDNFQFSNSDTKNSIKAETYALRAAMYFYLAKIWGNIPLVLNPVVDENEPLYPRTPVSEIFTQINSDISKSLQLFPEAGYADKYRFSKPAVYALLADVKMWTGKVLNGGNPDFNEAIDAIGEVENSNVALLTDYGSIFSNRKNNEIILSIYLNRDEYTSEQYNLAFLRFGTSGGADNASALPMSLVGQQAYTLSPRALALFQNYPEDKRIARTYIPEIIQGNIVNYWPNKFRGTQYADDRISDSDIIIYRLSDMLLLKAEAYAALNQPENALKCLNKVRERAGIPLFTENNKVLLEKEILDERGRELFHEMKRWWDLVRAHKSGVINVYEYVPNLKGKNTPLYWAVHTNVMAKNPKIEQTTGY